MSSELHVAIAGPQLFFPMYQAIYFEVTGLIYFTLTTSILMVLVNTVRVVVGLYGSVHQEADMFDKELEEMRAGLEGAPAPAPVPVSVQLGTMGTALASTPEELVGLINSLENDNKRIHDDNKRIHERLAVVENDYKRIENDNKRIEERLALVEGSHKAAVQTPRLPPR